MYCLLLMGLGLLSFVLYTWLQHLHLRRHGIRVLAEVISHSGSPQGSRKERGRSASNPERGRSVSSREPRRTDYLGLVVLYSPPDGRATELGVATGRPLSNFKPGEKVQVLFNPDKPSALAVFPDENVMIGPIILGIIGLVITVLGICVIQW